MTTINLKDFYSWYIHDEYIEVSDEVAAELRADKLYETAGKIKALRLELKKADGKKMDMDFFLETIRRYTDATTITRRMVGELIDHIDVYHAEKQDGVTNQRVVIHYNCIGAFDVPDRRKIQEADIIMETRKGIALSYSHAQIAA